MDDLQYSKVFSIYTELIGVSFKPCYIWMTFNTEL